MTTTTKLTETLREDLVTAVLAADLCCPEVVTDAVLAAAERGGREAALAELERAKAGDDAAARSLGI
jgi:hypothetical protein